jgi:hypothetical protein
MASRKVMSGLQGMSILTNSYSPRLAWSGGCYFEADSSFTTLRSLRNSLGKPEWPSHPQSFLPNPSVRYLNIWETLKTMGWVFEFAARMANHQILLPACRITIELHGVDGRELSYMHPTPRLDEKYWCQKEKIVVERLLAPEELKSKARELAVDAALEIFRYFNWPNPPRTLLAAELQKLLPG